MKSKHWKKLIQRMSEDDHNDDNKIPEQLRLKVGRDSGFFFGGLGQHKKTGFVGMPQGEEGNIIVIGGNGSGKSTGIAMPTLRLWSGATCATDIKGELSRHYADLYYKGLVTRPYIVFDPMDEEGPGYDPFDLLIRDDETLLVSNVRDIVRTIHPVMPDDHQPFWAKTEQDIFAAALLYYFKLGLSFSEAITYIMAQPISTLCEELLEDSDIHMKILLGEVTSIKPETRANFDRGLRNDLSQLATDPYISHAFRGRREGAACFTWEDLDRYNIFLRIPADKIEQWGSAINLMYAQMIRYFERKPEKHTIAGENNIQTLVLMDEFPRFGKLEMITNAVTTLRSKNVNICLMVQSLAQLDKIYGECDRRIILDNCQYQAVQRANDAETQRYLSDQIGTDVHEQQSEGWSYDKDMGFSGGSTNISEIRKPRIFPHELSTLRDILLLTPYGFCRVEKLRPDSEPANRILYPAPRKWATDEENVTIVSIDDPVTCSWHDLKWNEGATIMTIDE